MQANAPPYYRNSLKTSANADGHAYLVSVLMHMNGPKSVYSIVQRQPMELIKCFYCGASNPVSFMIRVQKTYGHELAHASNIEWSAVRVCETHYAPFARAFEEPTDTN